MRRPQSNGLFEVAGGQEKEHGFCCMELISLQCQGDVRTLRNVRFMRER